MAINDIMQRLKDENKKVVKRAYVDGDDVTITISRHHYNFINESLRKLARSKVEKMRSLPTEDFRRKSFGRNLYDINCLISELREALGERLV